MMSLGVDERGSGPRLVLAHGFTQNRNCWAGVDDALARRHQIVVVDLPGHGESSDIEADTWMGGRLLGKAGGHASYLGYSLGGRMSLHLALDAPVLVENLVLVSTHPGLDDDARALRHVIDERRAADIDRRGVVPFIHDWLSQDFFQTLPPAERALEERMENHAHGLASSLRFAGQGSQQPVWDRLSELVMPVLVVAGGLDQKYVDIARRTAESIGSNAQVAIIEDAGHAAHLERPEEFVTLVEEFLRV